MPLLSSLLILIVVARLLGQLAERFQQPSLLGEMLAGVLLGPALLNLIHPTPALSAIAELAVFLVILSAGLEMNFRDVMRVLKGKGLLISWLGFLVPFCSGLLVGVAFGLDVMRTVFLALCVSITALPVAARILQSFKLLDSDIARYSVGAAILNDLLAMLILGVILNLPEQATFLPLMKSVFWTGGKLALLATLVLGCNALLGRLQREGVGIQRFLERLLRVFGGDALFGLAVVFVLVFGSLSEALGFHFIIGAFFGALLIDRDYFLPRRYHELEKTISSVSSGFLAPVFFAFLGLEFNLGEVHSAGFVAVVLAVSILSKVLAGYFGGRAIGMPTERALGVGIILNGRGIVELVVAGIAFERGFIGRGLFSTLVLMGVVTTMITPALFRKFVLPRLSEARAG